MKKIFYFLNTVPEWIDVVEQLQKEKDWNPVLWVTTEILQPEIAKRLPQTRVVDLQSHKRGEFDTGIYANENIFLDKKIIEEYADCEKIVIPMMNRMDPTRHNFNYHQRIQLYYRTLMYWLFMFEKYQPDLVFFDETPHVPFEYIMHEVARKKNIKIVRFNPTHINHRLLLFGRVNETPEYIKQKYEEVKKTEASDSLSTDIEEYYSKLKGTYKDAMPYYMKKPPIDIKKKLTQIGLIFYRLLANQSDSSYQRTKDGYVQDFKTIKYIKMYNRKRGASYKRKLLKRYNQLANSELNLSKKYVYVPLHFQPERTTSPDGDIYENQWLMIQLLSKSVPNDWKIFVKEHVSQFRKDFSGEMGRNIEFYQEVLLFNNVELVPLSVSSYDLIDNSQCVATVSGTVGLESIVRNKRALVFGHPWFEICEGVTQIKNMQEIKEFFETIVNQEINQKYVKAFFQCIDEISLPGNHSGNVWNKDFDKKQNIVNLLELIKHYENEIE